VQLRGSRVILPLENSFGKSARKIKRLKSCFDKHFRDCADED
jgi:hypothetical protein